MPDIVVCYKWVADEADIKINADLSVDNGKAKGKISDYDRNAIEAAGQEARKSGGKAIGLTFGNAKSKQSLKDALSRGLDECCWVNSEAAAQADGAATARALTAAINKIGNYSLIICAEGASDTYARQIGPRIGALLNIPVVTSVSKMTINGNTLTVIRKLEDTIETVKTELPAVVAVLPEINSAPIPGLKAVMAAGKKKVAEYQLSDLGLNDRDMVAKTAIKEIKGYIMDRKNIIFKDGDAASKVNELMVNLRREGVL